MFMYQAIWKNQVSAESSDESSDTIEVGGNQYFPPNSVNKEYFEGSEQKSTCPWKGEASYYDVVVEGETNPAAAWYYPDLKEGAEDIPGADFSNYIAFWNGVEVKQV